MAEITVLVVEDEPVVARDIAIRLGELGYHCEAALQTAEEALQLLAVRSVNVVLMDIRLRGGIDGITAADRIRALHRVPVVFLTAYADEPTIRRAQAAEAYGYVLKPFETRDLRIAVEMALAKHRMEGELEASRRWLETTLRSIGDAVVAADTAGVVTFANPVAEALTRREGVRVVGNRLTDLVRTDPPLTAGERRTSDERVLLAADGRRIPIDITCSQIRAETGEGLGTVVIFRDSSTRKLAEKQIRASEERYKEFFEEDITGDYVAAVDGTLLECNPAYLAIFGFASLEMAKATNVFALYPGEESKQNFLLKLRVTGRLSYFEKELVRPDGTRVHVVENVIGRFDDRGQLASFKGYMFDDTRRKRLEDQLHQSQKMESIGTLSSGIAHDFNNILNNILGFASQLQKHPGDIEKVLRYARTIEQSATRGAELSTRLLSFARVGKPDTTPIDIPSIIDEVVTLCRETFPKSITIEGRLSHPLNFVRGDRGALYQVLLNLCLNSRDALLARHGSAAGTLIIQAHNTLVGTDVSPELFGGETSQCVELTVSDDGSGILPEIKERIFDPFFTTKGRGQGTGLGLSVVYTIVRNHRGTILVESEPGKGTTFRILLPALPPPPERVEKPPSPRHPRGTQELVLIVDDEEAMLELAREVLSEEGYRVVTARDGFEARSIYTRRHREIDLVILDLVMPGMDGAQCYRELKEVNPGIKAFFCTGYMPDQMVTSLISRDRLAVLQKPFTHDQLIRTIAAVLASPPLPRSV